jgi:hypothetical protein
MNVYIYIFFNVYTYIYIFIYIYVHIYILLYKYVRSIYVYRLKPHYIHLIYMICQIHVGNSELSKFAINNDVTRLGVWMYVCIYVYIYVCMIVWLHYISMYIFYRYICIHLVLSIYIHTLKFTFFLFYFPTFAHLTFTQIFYIYT